VSDARFARVVAIDFSAAAVPTLGRDSLWLGVAEGDGPVRTHNLATRHELARVLTEVVAKPGRSLVVLDVVLGWPAGTARALRLRGRPIEAVGSLLDSLLIDGADNANNRFAVADALNARSGTALFWGHPPGRRFRHLSATKAVPRGLLPRPVADQRLVESHVGRSIKSPMQLAGIGAVGGQSLVAQVFLRRLRSSGVPLSVWPFDPPRTRVVVGEYFFSLVDWRAERGTVTDERQVRAAVKFLRAELRVGRSPVRRALLAALTPAVRARVLNEEGWLVALCARAQ
jgi:hypothetical protein